MLVSVALVFAALAVLFVGAETLVRAAHRMADGLGVPPLLVGLTVVAYGTSAPELTVSVTAALDGRLDLIIGNALGSNVFNATVVIGVAALAAPLASEERLIRVDLPLGIAVVGLVAVLAGFGGLGRADGVALVLVLVAFTVAMIVGARSGTRAARSPVHAGRLARDVVLVGIGIGLLVVGGGWLVDGSVRLAEGWGASERWIALTLVAGGTSAPELAASLVAALRGRRDLALGNVVGSNLFNLTAVLGSGAALAPIAAPMTLVSLAPDLAAAGVVAIALLSVAATGRRIGRVEGAVLLAAWIVWVVVRA